MEPLTPVPARRHLDWVVQGSSGGVPSLDEGLLLCRQHEHDPGHPHEERDYRRVEAAEGVRWSPPLPQAPSFAIEKIKEGPAAGTFCFTAETVDKLRDYYDRVKYLPYKPGTTGSVYDAFIYEPGLIVPKSWANALPDWSKSIVLGKTIWQWLVLAAVLVGALVLIRALRRWGKRWDKRHRTAAAWMRFGAPLSVAAGILVLFGARLILVFGAKFVGEAWNALTMALWTLMFLRARLAEQHHRRSHRRCDQRGPGG